MNDKEVGLDGLLEILEAALQAGTRAGKDKDTDTDTDKDSAASKGDAAKEQSSAKTASAKAKEDDDKENAGRWANPPSTNEPQADTSGSAAGKLEVDVVVLSRNEATGEYDVVEDVSKAKLLEQLGVGGGAHDDYYYSGGSGQNDASGDSGASADYYSYYYAEDGDEAGEAGKSKKTETKPTVTEKEGEGRFERCKRRRRAWRRAEGSRLLWWRLLLRGRRRCRWRPGCG